MIFAAILTSLSLIGWLYLTFLHAQFWRPFMAETVNEPSAWPSVDIIVPARNESDPLHKALPSLLEQDYPGTWRVILVDDHSDDGTPVTANKLAAAKKLENRLTVITASELPGGWTGKLNAMNAGVAQSSADYILFTDADIFHMPDSLRKLVARAMARRLDLVSLMVKLHCVTFAEQFMIPAFVFFFAMLYPFRRANDPNSSLAAAAGGVMLVRRAALNNIGGLASIKSALIDDCALAKAIKHYGGNQQTAGRIELSMTRDIESLRVYPDMADVWRMVTRCAFTQLNYSGLWLALSTAGMAILFVLPALLPLTGWPLSTEMGLAAWFIMTMLYLPMTSFYGLPFFWAFTLPAAAVVYMAATIDSARLYWQGKGGQWKGRTQA